MSCSFTQVKLIYPIIENACRQLEQYIDNRIDAGQTIFNTKDVSLFVELE